TGIVINAVYDAWTPARAYQHYHGGVRILSEAASANLASPIDLPADQLATRGRGFNPRERSWNLTNPWPGGRWTLRDIVTYQTDGAYALDRKSTRLNSSHVAISYAVFCLKKKNTQPPDQRVSARPAPTTSAPPSSPD